MALIQCQSCFSLMSESAVDDLDGDQCPDCGQYASFELCEVATEADMDIDLGEDDDGDWWACAICDAANDDSEECADCGAPRGASGE